MKSLLFSIKYVVIIAILVLTIPACDNKLNEPLEGQATIDNVDYTKSEQMFELLKGAYQRLYALQWETFPVIAVRGDDVNAAGDQFPLIETDEYRYDPSFWMYNSAWQNLYGDFFDFYALIEEIRKYKVFAPNPAIADQYEAEIKVMIGFELLQLSRLWGGVLIPKSSAQCDLYNAPLSTKDEVMQFISDMMDEAIPNLPVVHPKERSDIRGGMTRYTALSVKAMANLELKNFQKVADATSAIITSNKFSLETDYYNLFKIPGKLNNENIMELQYSDLGQSSGTNFSYLYAFFGPQGWTPARANAGSGWGFWEPSIKYIKFMLDRGEQLRLETSVLFTNRGIAEIKTDPNYANLPGWISNTTRDGDIINDYARARFASGKHYLPSVQLTPGRNEYGTNKNFICIRYAEILLMHAEALVNGASSSSITADQAVNLVRSRAGLNTLSGVTLTQVLDEKFAEFAMEWGIRFYDLVRYDKTTELNYEGRTYNADDRFIPYPLAQVDLLPQLKK